MEIDGNEAVEFAALLLPPNLTSEAITVENCAQHLACERRKYCGAVINLIIKTTDFITARVCAALVGSSFRQHSGSFAEHTRARQGLLLHLTPLIMGTGGEKEPLFLLSGWKFTTLLKCALLCGVVAKKLARIIAPEECVVWCSANVCVYCHNKAEK